MGLYTYKLHYRLFSETHVKEFDSSWDLNEFWYDLEEKYVGEGDLEHLGEEIVELAEDEMVFVNVYTVTRHYGGPEEGGWWYNWFECVEVIPVQYQYADDLAEAFEEKYIKSQHKHGNIYSVLGGQDVVVYVEKHPKQSESKERPIYE